MNKLILSMRKFLSLLLSRVCYVSGFYFGWFWLPILEINFSTEHNITEINYRKEFSMRFFILRSLVADAPKEVLWESQL